MEIQNFNTLTEAQLAARVTREKVRGIVRDEQGRIVRSKEWMQNKIKALE